MSPRQTDAQEYYQHLIAQGKSHDAAVLHCQHRFGVEPELRRHPVTDKVRYFMRKLRK